jgi:hypothetical protein
MTASGSLCDIHRCPLYGHSGHQPSELSARPPALAVSLPVALLGGFEFFALSLLKLALALLGLGDLPPVVLEHAPSRARGCLKGAVRPRDFPLEGGLAL